MCGIAGWIGKPEPKITMYMLETLSHRGPDNDGEWFDKVRGVWLGHRRLSVIDLSTEGNQPAENIPLAVMVIVIFKQLTAR
jgi:asparagine synthase (glutamine-hydrolysing)